MHIIKPYKHFNWQMKYSRIFSYLKFAVKVQKQGDSSYQATNLQQINEQFREK